MIFKNYRVDALKPQTWRNQVHWWFVVGLLRMSLRSLFRVSTADIRTVPLGPLIVAPNHRSFLDPALVGSLLDRRVIFMMHAKYYDHDFLNWCYRMARCIVVEGEGDNRKALRAGKKVLDAGHALCIFPEGTISPDGEQQPAQPGMAWLARKTGVPILPVHLGGTREALTKGRKGVRFSPITMRVGKVIETLSFEKTREGSAELTAAVMQAIAELDPAAGSTPDTSC